MRQRTIKNSIEIVGIGLHKGLPVNIRLEPLEANMGIVFYRSDENVSIKLDINSVVDTKMATVIGENGIVISTIEHLLSAVYAYGIDNLKIVLDNDEVPILDGSSSGYCMLIEEAGIKEGDIIKFIDEIKISKFSDLKGYLSTKRPNDLVIVHLVSDKKIKKLEVRLNKNERISFNVIGILKNLSQEELIKYNKSNGVKISDFNKRYEKYWTDNGIEIGNIIQRINGVDIKSITDVQDILKNINNYDPLRIEIINSNDELERFNFR